MKKFLMTLALLLSVVVGYAQTEEQIEQVKAIEGTYELDENFGYSYTRVYEGLEGNKDELFNRALSFFPYIIKGTYNAGDIIQQEDKEKGLIVAKFAHNNVASHSNLAHIYHVSATPIWRIDLKDGRCRVIVTNKKWILYHRNSSGIVVTYTDDEITTTFVAPFAKGKKKKLNEMYTNAFLQTHDYTITLLDMFDEFMREKGNGKEKVSDDW